jgi:hypothetical protein
MPEQFENPEVTKLEDETVSDATAKKRIERVAEKAAEKPSHTSRITTRITRSFPNRKDQGPSISNETTGPSRGFGLPNVFQLES